ncbi:MAG: DeoR family transcriptional regulator, fructose operon transcriptional repressor [Pseudonocardiales bacterium]|nr:DeoR family transcriptional regulator, fructose operon transcriptional repressor [Pseudonocardiales bacterium]
MRTILDTDGSDGVERIVKAALAELPLSGPILLGPGAATERLAEALPTDSPLTVVTNAVTIAHNLAPRPEITVVLLGGRLDRRSGAAIDPWTLETLAQTYAEVAFVVPDGLSVRRGLTAVDLATATVYSAMIRAARRTVLLVDRFRIGADRMARFGDLADVDVVITESDVDDHTAAGIASRGPRVVRA